MHIFFMRFFYYFLQFCHMKCIKLTGKRRMRRFAINFLARIFFFHICANKMCSIFFHPCILQDWNDEMVVDTVWNWREKNKISTIIYRHRYCLACMYEIFFLHLSVKFMLLAKWWSLSAHCNMWDKMRNFHGILFKIIRHVIFYFDFLQGKMIHRLTF